VPGLGRWWPRRDHFVGGGGACIGTSGFAPELTSPHSDPSRDDRRGETARNARTDDSMERGVMSGAALWAWAFAAPAVDARHARLAQAVPAGV